MKIAVYGAAGHTGRFVVAELHRRGHEAVAIGRDLAKLEAAFGSDGRAFELRVAQLDTAASLDAAFAGVDAVVHCAGPFLDTARPIIEAALRAGIHYFDVTAEQGSALSTLDEYASRARERGVALVPAAGFYGGLADLIASAAMKDWNDADRIDIAVALDSWKPTRGTRITGERNTAQRLVLIDGALRPLQPSAPAPRRFAEPFGVQNLVEIPFTETILISRHLRVPEIHHYLNEAPLQDVRNPLTEQPIATDEYGRSDQQFLVEVVIRRGDTARSLTARGRDIYAVTAPIIVEAVERICSRDRANGGAFALGELVDAGAFLQCLAERGALTTSSSIAA